MNNRWGGDTALLLGRQITVRQTDASKQIENSIDTSSLRQLSKHIIERSNWDWDG